MLVTSLQTDYLTKTANINNNTMVQSVDVPFFYNNRISPMADELLSLKWNNHKSTFADILSVLRDQEVFVDVTLACGGKLYPAHKFVLSTCSEYFREMFTKNPCKHPIVYMKDVSGRDLEALLDFMYRGEVNVPQTHLTSLIQTAEGLQIKGLAVPDEQQQLNQSSFFNRRNRELFTPRPPPAPSICPSPKRKRMKEETNSYTPVGSLNMMYANMSPQEPNSPYDLSQKSSSSSSISQSDAVHNDRAHSVSPDQPPPQAHPSHPSHPLQQQQQQQQQHHQPSSSDHSVMSSTYNNKENSPDILRRNSMCAEESIRHSRSPRRSPRPVSRTTPLPAPSTPGEMNSRDSGKEESEEAVAGPSGMHSKTSDEDDEVDVKPTIKQDLMVEDEEDESEWVGGGSDGGETNSGDSSIQDHPHHHHHSEASNSSLPTLDPALTREDLSALETFDSSINKLQCPCCSKVFKTLGSLKRHYRSHINFKPYVCDLCGKCFTLNQYLIEHKRTHTGEKPYECHVCHKCFAQTGTLYHHMHNVHQAQWAEKPVKIKRL